MELEQVQVSLRGLRKGLDTLSHESKQSGALGMIDKQRRGWEEAREKAEQMSQIFDSLIITNDRPYVSCGIELAATCPGLIDFSQFELINKVREHVGRLTLSKHFFSIFSLIKKPDEEPKEH